MAFLGHLLHRGLASRLRALGSAEIRPHPIFDQDREVPLLLFLRKHGGRFAMEKSPLTDLVIAGETFQNSLKLRHIGAVLASKGEHVMSLDSLPETMHLAHGQTYGPLSDEQIESLTVAVHREFPCRNGRFEIWLQQWDNLYIGINSGASRRFALLRRLQPDRYIDVSIKSYSLRNSWRQDLCEQRRLIGVEEDTAVWEIISDLEDHGFQWIQVNSHIPNAQPAAFMALPTLTEIPTDVRGLLRAIHRKVDSYFDLGRYLSERISQARMREETEKSRPRGCLTYREL